MKKNYFLKNATKTSTPLVLNCEKKSLKNTLTGLFLFLFTFLGFSDVFGQTTETITTTGAGTWTVPCGVTSITVEAWGAGGSGGGTTADNSRGGGGGAGGTYVSSTIAVTPGTTYNLFVAPQNNGANSAGTKGQGSWFINNTTLFAEGGNGGAAPNGAAGAAGGTGSIALSIGTTRIAGANGANGTNTVGGAGGGGANGGGAGGNQRNTGGNGNAGTPPGGGGGGAYVNNNTNRSGGNGARGEIRIAYTSPFATYCPPTFTSAVEPITNVTFAGINNTTSNVVNGTPALESFCDVANVQQGLSYPISLKGNSGGNFVNYYRVYVDWDQNGTFGNVGNEIYDIGTITNSTGIDAITLNGTITVPIGASLGDTRMRVMKRYNAYSTGPCQTGAGYGQAEDYTVNVSTPPACVAPTAQPTALVLTPGSTTVNGSFGASVPVSDSYLVVMNTTGIAPTPVNGTTYTIGGTVGAGNTVIDIDGNTNFTATGLTPLTTYYFFVFSTSSACSGGPLYLTTSPLTGSTTTILSYCAAGGTTPASSYISNVNLSAINQNSPDWGGYTDYYSTSNTNLTRTITYTFSVTIFNATPSQKNIAAWIDWNRNGVFDVGTETILSTTSTVATAQFVTLTNNITVPAGAVIDETRLRVELAFNSEGAATPCNTNSLTDVQDYKVTILDIFPCVTPTSQPTALMLTPSGSSISGSFAPSVPSSDSYLVVMNTTGITPPNPVNGTTYVIGGTLGAGNTIVDNDNNTSFVATGLSNTTTYYFFIYSYNGICTGGPLYYTTSPLTGNATTTTADPVYCTPSVGATYESLTFFSNISFVGTLNDISNSSSYSTAPRGYQDFSTIPNRSRQAQGEGINISTQTTNRGYLKAWVDWNRDGDFLDAGELVYDVGGIASYSTTFGFIIPPAQPVGNYRIRIRINKDDAIAPFDPNAISTFNSCQNIDYFGETEDYTFTVVASCSAVITNVTDGTTCGTGTVNLSATSAGSPSEFRWYTTEFGGTPVATTATGTWTTPSISTTTHYWVTSFNGCESLVRTKVTAHVSPVATITFTPSVPEVCGENNVLSLTASGDVQQTYLVDEKFEAGLGFMTNNNIVSNGADDAITQWQTQSSTFVPSEQVWFPAISSGIGGNGFAMSTSDVGPVTTHNEILTPVVNTNTYLNLTLSFDIFYSRYYIDNDNPTLDYVTVDVSTNGGGAWIEIDRYLADIGVGTRFENKTYDLSAYINQPNFRVRIRYYGEWCDGLAIDNFQLFGDVPLNTAFEWSAITPVEAFVDAACTISYTAGTPITTVYVRPTLSQLEATTYEFTATATLTNGCAVSQNVMIDNRSKVWKGTNSNDWNDPNNWLPVGVPDPTTCVIIPDVTSTNYSNIGGAGYDAYGRTLQVLEDGELQLRSGNTITIGNFVEVRGNGIFNIEDTASLIQIDDVVNTGNITMRRNVNIRQLDYVYWSSPVANFASSAVSPLTPTGFIYKWAPTLGSTVNNHGNWIGGNESMVNGKGYILRGPSTYTSTLQNFTANFVGVPNNGNITIPVSRGTYDGANYNTGLSSTLATRDDDNWNLLGNPYPSAISANTFLATNTNLAGFIKFWTHGTLPSAVASDPFYNNYAQNYTVADYVTYNATGANPPIGNGNIAAGQGFFVLMNHTSAATTENVVFNNSMRRNDYRNDLFFRNSNTTNSENEEKHRIWLNLISPSATSSTTLVGYVSGATNDLDRMYDAPALDVKTNFELYSFSNTDKLNIQGKSLPFNDTDQIPLGISIAQNGIHTLGISTVDGLFESASQGIYLEDRNLGITHDLRVAPYSFTATTGRFENRFVLKFNNETLGNEDFIGNNVTVYTNESINISAPNQVIKSVRVHDLLGRVLGTFNNVNSDSFSSKNIAKTQSPLLVEVTLENGATKTYKVIF